MIPDSAPTLEALVLGNAASGGKIRKLRHCGEKRAKRSRTAVLSPWGELRNSDSALPAPSPPEAPGIWRPLARSSSRWRPHTLRTAAPLPVTAAPVPSRFSEAGVPRGHPPEGQLLAHCWTSWALFYFFAVIFSIFKFYFIIKCVFPVKILAIFFCSCSQDYSKIYM